MPRYRVTAPASPRLRAALQREFEDTDGLDLLVAPQLGGQENRSAETGFAAAAAGAAVMTFLLQAADSPTVHTAINKVRDKLGGTGEIEVDEDE
jgi:hypothetical protein